MRPETGFVKPLLPDMVSSFLIRRNMLPSSLMALQAETPGQTCLWEDMLVARPCQASGREKTASVCRLDRQATHPPSLGRLRFLAYARPASAVEA